MRLFDSFCEALTRALGLSSLTSFEPKAPSQTPLIRGRPLAADRVSANKVDLGTKVVTGRGYPTNPVYWGEDAPAKGAHIGKNVIGPLKSHVAAEAPEGPPGPKFKPPSATEGFLCDYSAMLGWKHVGNADARGIWLEKPIDPFDETGGIYDVFTDFDFYWPTGVTRRYHLDAEDFPINADGVTRSGGGKTFNQQYPGPRIEACWGDWLEITVRNSMKYNGTTVHFHGARQYQHPEADGVNAVTQCPIAPGDSHTYKFRVTQYGTSWYHSHYSLQYADGLAGPMTFYGPATGNYDEALEPYLFGDWSHNSAFEDYYWELHNGRPMMQTTILNGRGYFNCSLANEPRCDDASRPALYEQYFERGRRYLIRLINTSTASTFVFSIDKHILKVVQSDLVSIEPYYAQSILVGIGQRYNVIVEALPSNELIPDEDQNYWIRIVAADFCNPIIQNNPLVGIIRYNEGSTKTPTSKPYQFSTYCSDEPYESLVPIVRKTVSAGPTPANNISPDGGDFYGVAADLPDPEYIHPYGNFWRWEILDLPMWLNFSDPTINHIEDKSWKPTEYAIIDENFGEHDWIYIILSAVTSRTGKERRQYHPLAHPVHLHGHDYIMLAQEDREFHPDDLTNGTFHYDNPPRRDTVLLPGHGYVAIAFQADNPGIWAYHCHIAWHASSGFGVQIREREHDIKLSDEILAENDRVCKNWDEWFANKDNWWDPHEFQEDSGI